MVRRGNIDTFVRSKLFALNIASKYVTGVILLVRLISRATEISI